MDETENEITVEEVEETTDAELTEVTDWEAEAKKARGIAQRLRTQLVKAKEKKIEVPVKEEQKTSELDTADLAYLAVKGYESDEEIAYIQQKMEKLKLPLRELLKEDVIQSHLKGLKIEREVKDAMPSNTKRSGNGQIDNVDYWLAKYDQTGELPTDFTLRSAVVNAKVAQANPNKPAWH